MSLLSRLRCAIGLNDWTHRARDNYSRLIRRCAHFRKQQQLVRVEPKPAEYWQ